MSFETAETPQDLLSDYRVVNPDYGLLHVGHENPTHLWSSLPSDAAVVENSEEELFSEVDDAKDLPPAFPWLRARSFGKR